MEMALIWLFRLGNLFKVDIVDAEESWLFPSFFTFGFSGKSRLFIECFFAISSIWWLLLLILRQTW